MGSFFILLTFRQWGPLPPEPKYSPLLPSQHRNLETVFDLLPQDLLYVEGGGRQTDSSVFGH